MHCPGCGHDNIAGVDLCEHCGFDLAGLDVGAWSLDPGDPVLALPMREFRLKEPLVLPPEASVHDAIELMKERREGCVFVQEGAELCGVFTERDVTVRVAGPRRDPQKTRLEDVMTPDPTVLGMDDPLALAFHRMGHDGYRHLAVVDGGRLRGFLSARTVLEELLRA
jgi:CBS domain-containing protein